MKLLFLSILLALFSTIIEAQGGYCGSRAQASTKITHQQAMAGLTCNAIKRVSSGNCANRNGRTCTSLEQVRHASIAGAITLKKACRCDLTVTGGTETGHANGANSHWAGFKIDFRKNARLNSYITRTFTRVSGSYGIATYVAASGNRYVDEGSHWDVTFCTNGRTNATSTAEEDFCA